METSDFSCRYTDGSDSSRYRTCPDHTPSHSTLIYPVFNMGSGVWNGRLTIALYTCLVINICIIIAAFCLSPRRSLQRMRVWRTILYPLLYALVAIVVVTALRWEHLFRRADSRDGRWWDGQGHTAWHSFERLVDVPQSRWFAFQWYMAHFAWSVYVVIECKRRSVGYLVALSFIMLGFCISLSGMQFVFYALQMLSPTVNTGLTSLDAFPTLLTVLGLFETIALVLLPSLPLMYNYTGNLWWEESDILWVSLRVSLVLLPAMAALLAFYPWKPVRRRNVTAAKRNLYCAWSAISVLSIGLHLFTAYQAWSTVRKGVQWMQLFSLLPWRDGHMNGLDRWTLPGIRRLGALCHDPWVDSVAWDVIFSGIGLCVWSVASSCDPRVMIECSIFPWLSDVEEVAKRATKATAEGAMLRNDSDSEGSSSGSGRLLTSRRPVRGSGQSSAAEYVSRHNTRSRALRSSRHSVSSRLTSGSRRAVKSPNAGALQSVDTAEDDQTASEMEAACLTLALWLIGGLGMSSVAVFAAAAEETDDSS